jgi:hypothetical protein
MRRGLTLLAILGVGAAVLVEGPEPEAVFRTPELFEDDLSDALFAFQNGDNSAAPKLTQWLTWELQRPATGPRRHQRALLVEAALGGIGPLETTALDMDRARIVHGREGDCALPSDACLELLIELLEVQGDPFGEQAWREPPPVEPSIAEDLAEVTIAPQLLARAAAWVAESEDPATRLLDTVARTPHAYHGWNAGQRGDPLDVMRYGTGSPGAVAVAALALGEGAGIEVTLGRFEGFLVVRVGELEAVLGQCGPQRRTVTEVLPLSREDALDLARMDHAAGLLHAGQIEAAISATARVTDPRIWPGMEAVHARLLAAQGLVLPGFTEPPPSKVCEGPAGGVVEDPRTD